jgi:hypothetical protein
VGRWIDGETGIRSDVPHNMIYPLKETRPNLHIVTGVHVKRAIFDEYVFHLAISVLPFSFASSKTPRTARTARWA